MRGDTKLALGTFAFWLTMFVFWVFNVVGLVGLVSETNEYTTKILVELVM